MFRMKFVFVVSLIAMFAFGSSFADIASTSYAVAAEQGASGAGKAMITDNDGRVITGKVKPGMTDGVYGYIPTNENGTGSALIWVE